MKYPIKYEAYCPESSIMCTAEEDEINEVAPHKYFIKMTCWKCEHEFESVWVTINNQEKR